MLGFQFPANPPFVQQKLEESAHPYQLQIGGLIPYKWAEIDGVELLGPTKAPMSPVGLAPSAAKRML